MTILDGGPRTQEDDYVGQPRELRADTSNQDLRLHDGSKPGGFRIANVDSNDVRYQRRNPELDALKFPPGSAGILTRLSNGLYAIRRMFVDGGLSIENPLGQDGNFIIRLGSEIEQDMNFKGDVLVDGVFEATGGINGDVSGNLTGNVEGNTEGTHTGPHVGDVDVRGKTLLLDNDQIDQAKVDGLSEALNGIRMPVGTIVMWGLGVAAIPSGWALCNGDNGTPDLTDRFILGAVGDDDVYEIGGTESHLHVVTSQGAGTHSHSASGGEFTLEVIHMPSHQHANGVVDAGAGLFNHGSVAANPALGDSIDNNDDSGINEGLTTFTGGGQAHAHSVTVESAGSHTHIIDVTATSHIPPFIRILYIMRIS